MEKMTRAEMNARIIELLEKLGVIPPEQPQPQSYDGVTDSELTEMCIAALDQLGLITPEAQPERTGDSE